MSLRMMMQRRRATARFVLFSFLLLVVVVVDVNSLSPSSGNNRPGDATSHKTLGSSSSSSRNHHRRNQQFLAPVSVSASTPSTAFLETETTTTTTTAIPRHTSGGGGAAAAATTPLLLMMPHLDDILKDKSVVHVQASLGANIFLHCPIVDIGEDVQVSWVRLPDWRIVASGRNVYNNQRDGERYRVLHAQDAEDWTLQIKFAAVSDRGLYECQVATGTGIVTHYFNVSVIVATTSIVGGHEYHVDKGSTIQLACIIHNAAQEPQFIFWYHNDRMINYDRQQLQFQPGKSRARVQVLTESMLAANKGKGLVDHANSNSNNGDRVLSQLTVRNVTDADSGNYTCAPSNAEPTSTMVYVSEGDDAAAAIQVGDSDTDTVNSSSAGGIVNVVSSSNPVVASGATSGHRLTLTPLSSFFLLSFVYYYHHYFSSSVSGTSTSLVAVDSLRCRR